MFFQIFKKNPNAAQLITVSLMRIALFCCRRFDSCFLIAASSDEWRDKAGLGPVTPSWVLPLSSPGEQSRTFQRLLLYRCFYPSQDCFPVSWYLQRAIPSWPRYKLWCRTFARMITHIKTQRDVAFPPRVPLWWINDLLLWLLALLILLGGGAV